LMPIPDGVVDVPARQRFEWIVAGHLTQVRYRRVGRVLWLDYVGVPSALGGRGIGTQLVSAVCAQVRARGERIVAVCPFVVRYLALHPEQTDLVALPD